MALTITPLNKVYGGAGAVLNFFTFTASGSGDTAVLTVSGPQPVKIEFMDANSNQIITSGPTVGAWTTTGGSSAATVTANAGGVVTNGRMIVVGLGA